MPCELKRLTLPLAPIFTVTRLGTVCPATKLQVRHGRLRSSPDGHAVMNPDRAVNRR